MKRLLRLELGCAVGAARHMLLQLVAGIVCQLAVNVEHDILSYPFALHILFLCLGVIPKDPRVLCRPPALAGGSRSERGRVLACSRVSKSLHFMSASAPRSFCVARNSVFLAVSSVVCKISPTVRSFNPW